MQLGDHFRPGGLSWRRLHLLVTQLPSESLTKTAIRDALTDEQVELMRKSQVEADHGPWSKQDYLLAAAVDGINVLTATVSGALGGKYAFDPVDRPFLPKAKSNGLTPSERDYLQRIRAARGGQVE